MRVRTIVEPAQLIFPLLGIVKRFQRGCGGTENNRAFLDVGPQHRDIATMVSRRGVLFVGIVVFFIDKDQPEIGQGSEHGGARADDDAGFAIADAMPFIKALALGETADAMAEATYENCLNGSYPLARFLYVYVNKDPNAPLDKLTYEFLKFVLSKEGQEVVVKDHYFPLPASIASEITAAFD
jgi:hypothetical protein